MDFNPVTINNIRDVLPHITDKPEIIHMVKDGYHVLDYVYSGKDTFDNPYAKECRGIKFDSDGNIIARPYHKFHNVNENEEYASANIDLSKPHHRLDKLDGSMVHNALVEGKWRLMTRKGESEVALKAFAFLASDRALQERYHGLFNGLKEHTFIFEYVAPHNRIVIAYKKEELILTGVRHITSGHYLSYDRMVSLGEAFGIPVVGLYTGTNVAEDKEKEGEVTRWETGAMAKVKSDIYVRKHKSKDLVSKFKDLVKLIMDDDLDDVLPQLDDKVKAKVLSYKDDLYKQIGITSQNIEMALAMRSGMSQKEFALDLQANVARSHHALLFNARKSGDSREEIKRCIQKAYGDTTKLDTLFDELKLPKFVGDFFSE